MRRLGTGTGFAGAKLSEILSAPVAVAPFGQDDTQENKTAPDQKGDAWWPTYAVMLVGGGSIAGGPP